MADIIKINDSTWRIEDGHVRFFLFCGTSKAALIRMETFSCLEKEGI